MSTGSGRRGIPRNLDSRLSGHTQQIRAADTGFVSPSVASVLVGRRGVWRRAASHEWGLARGRGGRSAGSRPAPPGAEPGAQRRLAAGAYVDLIGSAILRHGTEAQRRRFLARLLSGEDLWCQGFSEPGAGSDLGALRTRGERRGDGFVVNGQKVWTSYADVADWCFLLCRTEPEAPKHHGISLLLVDMRSPGISVRPLKQITGDAEFSEVFFEGVRVPAEMMVGAAGAGWQIAMGILAHERGPVWTFTFQRAIRRSLERLLGAARAHPAARRALADPGYRQRLAQAHIEVELLRLVGYRSLTRPLRTRNPWVESSVEKVLGHETDQRLPDLTMHVLGPWAVLDDERRRAYLYSRSETIMGGTSEIQRNLIAQRILGLRR